MNANQFDLWIPASADAGIAPRSAVVSSCDQAGETRLCYFEGNVYGADNLRRFSDRVRCAVGRAVHRYPTLARSRLPVAMLRHVGTFDARSQRITAITDPAMLSDYLTPEPPPCLLTAEEARRRVAAAMAPFLPTPPHGPVWQRLHAWTGQTRREAGGMAFECVTEDAQTTEWLCGIAYWTPHLTHGLRHLLDQETVA